MPSKLARSINKVLAKGGSDKAITKELVSFAQEKIDAGRQLRRPYEVKWYITRAFLRGEQYVFWNRGTGHLDRSRSIDPRRIRMVDNKILQYTRKQQSKLIRLRPRAEVLPNTNEQSDIDAANLGTKLLEHLQRILEGPRLSREIAAWISCTGNAFVVDYWNEQVPGGEVGFEIDSPFCWYFPALSHGATELQDMPWIGRAKLRSLEWIKEVYDFDAKPESFSADQNVLLLMKELDQQVTGLEHVYMPSAVVKEFWIKPNKQYKKGMYIVICNNQLVHKGKFPNYGKEDDPIYLYPVTHFRDIKIPGLFWGMATAEAAIPLQKDFNRIRSSIIEWTRTMAKGKWIAPSGSALHPTAIDNEHGEVIYFSPKRGLMPQQVRLSPLPVAVLQSLEINQQSFMDLYAQHEVTRGTNKSDIRSGAMVALLLEQDDTAHSMTYMDYEDSWAKMWKKALMLAQKYYKNTRTLKVLGAAKTWAVTSFLGADLKNNTDVHVVTGIHLPENRVAKHAVIMERFQIGLYGPPQDPKVQSRVRRMLDDAVPEDIYNDTEIDIEYAQNENRAMRNGLPVEVQDYDNHQIHIREHERDLKGGEVQARIKKSGGAHILSAYRQHLALHSQALAEHMKRMQQMMPQQPQGQRGGTGQPLPQGMG